MLDGEHLASLRVFTHIQYIAWFHFQRDLISGPVLPDLKQ